MDFWDTFLASTFAGIVAGLLGFSIQYYFNKRREEKKSREELIRGKHGRLILDRDFLYSFPPHNLTIPKIYREFNEPNSIDEYNDKRTFIYYFQNAYVKFTTREKSESIESVTLITPYSHREKYPINCRLRPSVKPLEFGKARITRAMIENCIHFENFNHHKFAFTMIVVKYDEVETQNLSFVYTLGEYFKSPEDAENEIIDQISITLSWDSYESFHMNDILHSPDLQ